MKQVKRTEDMSPDGYLKLIWQEDGDIIVVAREGGADAGLGNSVEFCSSGGHSHRTLDALRELYRAMEADNRGGYVTHRREQRHQDRAGRCGECDDLISRCECN